MPSVIRTMIFLSVTLPGTSELYALDTFDNPEPLHVPPAGPVLPPPAQALPVAGLVAPVTGQGPPLFIMRHAQARPRSIMVFPCAVRLLTALRAADWELFMAYTDCGHWLATGKGVR